MVFYVVKHTQKFEFRFRGFVAAISRSDGGKRGGKLSCPTFERRGFRLSRVLIKRSGEGTFLKNDVGIQYTVYS